DENLDTIKNLTEELAQVSGKLAEKAYKEKASGEENKEGDSDSSEKDSTNNDNVVDADFEEVKDGEK
mgnify:CR=1